MRRLESPRRVRFPREWARPGECRPGTNLVQSALSGAAGESFPPHDRRRDGRPGRTGRLQRGGARGHRMKRFRLTSPRVKLVENDVERACVDLLRLRGYYVVRLQSGLFRTPDGRWIRIGEPG